MKYINHVTLNTGHIRKTYPNEVDKTIYFTLKRILKDSFKHEGAELYPGYTLKSNKDNGTTIGTIFAADGMPIITTTCSKKDNGDVWKILHDSSFLPLATKETDIPPLPYVADRIEPGAAIHLDAMKWTGDFSRCFAWVVLSPQSIR